MGMNNAPASDRVHIGFFRRRNVGKSNVLSAVTSQDLAMVSNMKGTTTDPMHKVMGLLPLGPVVMIDTPGIGDKGEPGNLHVRKSYQVPNETDVAVLVVDHCYGMAPEGSSLLKRIEEKWTSCVTICDKMGLRQKDPGQVDWKQGLPLVKISALTGQGVTDLKEYLVALGKIQENSRRIMGDPLEPQDFTALVVSIDKATPKGRLTLSQQQIIRDILEADATAVILRENGLTGMLPALGKESRTVITNSQVFTRVSIDMPKDILLTSFSTLFARYKGDLEQLVEGVTVLDHIGKGDRILVSEGCTCHRQCGDIGTVRPPPWIQDFMGAEPEFVFTSGTESPDDLSGYHLIIHYGGYMLNERGMKYRMKCARDQCTPMASYGITTAYIHGILRRSLESFPHVATLLDRRGIQAEMKGSHEQWFGRYAVTGHGSFFVSCPFLFGENLCV